MIVERFFLWILTATVTKKLMWGGSNCESQQRSVWYLRCSPSYSDWVILHLWIRLCERLDDRVPLPCCKLGRGELGKSCAQSPCWEVTTNWLWNGLAQWVLYKSFLENSKGWRYPSLRCKSTVLSNEQAFQERYGLPLVVVRMIKLVEDTIFSTFLAVSLMATSIRHIRAGKMVPIQKDVFLLLFVPRKEKEKAKTLGVTHPDDQIFTFLQQRISFSWFGALKLSSRATFIFFLFTYIFSTSTL